MSRRLSHIGVTKTERKSDCKLGVCGVQTDRQTCACVFLIRLYGCCVVLSEAVRMSPNDEGYVVRIRGLPWSCTQEEVASFFSGRNLHDQENQSRTNLDIIHHDFCFVGNK